MIVDSAMSADVLVVAPGDTVRQAAQRMGDRRVGSVVVTEGGALRGILTERDLTGRVVAAGRDPDRTRVEEVMSSPVLTIEPHVHLDDCLRRMDDHAVKRLVVVLDGRLRGIVTVTDIAHVHPALSDRLRGALKQRWED